MKVTDSFQAARALQRLPDDFKLVQVSTESLKDNLWRRLCRSIEEQIGLDQAQLDHDPVSYLEYLNRILNDQLWDTTDLSKTLIVLGNKSGALSGRFFDVPGSNKLFIDIGEIPEKYPIFLDTSVEKALKSGRTSSDFKRERDETFTVLSPPAKRPEAEKFSDLQAAWFEQEQEYQKQISSYRALFDSASERNHILAQESAENQKELEIEIEKSAENRKELENEIEILRTQVRDLQSEPMDLTNFVTMEEHDHVKQVNTDLMTQLEQVPKVLPLLGSGGSVSADSQPKSKEKPWTLAHYGLKPWDPNTVSFLDYYVGFRATMSSHELSVKDAVNLIFAVLPVKYSYIRGITSNDSSSNLNFDKTMEIIIRMIVGGKDKIFTEFMGTQKKTGETMIEFYQRILQYYRFSQATTNPVDDNDSNAFRLIRDKIVKAYPSKFVTEFKRKLEDKTKLSDILAAILHINDNFTEDFNNPGYSADISVLKSDKRPQWHKNAKCYVCQKKGHIARNCFKREGKTKKNGGRFSKKN